MSNEITELSIQFNKGRNHFLDFLQEVICYIWCVFIFGFFLYLIFFKEQSGWWIIVPFLLIPKTDKAREWDLIKKHYDDLK